MKKRGFTLIELLVVISIIAILVGLAMVSFGGAQKQARDTQRKSDLHQYRNSLQSYAASSNNLYPIQASAVNLESTVCQSYLITSGHISDCPKDPTNSSPNVYMYQSNSNGSHYRMYTDLETGDYWIVCSDGRSLQLANVSGTCF